MCTIIALRNVRADFPLVLATNRDEFYARASAGAARILDTPVAVGGRDLAAGGTWMGVTAQGLFVGVTNQRTFTPPDRTKRSRGELVMGALARGDIAGVRGLLRSEDGRAYNAFNLLFGDAHALYAAYGRPDAREIELEPVPEGVHVLPNDRLDSPDFLKVERAKRLLAGHTQEPWDALRTRLAATLSDGLVPPLDAIPGPPPGAAFDKALLARLAALCVRTPSYGTRSSTIVALEPGRVGAYFYADGPPDQTEFVDVRALLDAQP
jgi:uncharacterized protein with NRDE domain